MFDRLLGRKFSSKCKTAIDVTKTRLEAIRKKSNVVQKYLKSDVACLLRNGLDFNAYRRVEWLLVEQNILACYEIVEQFCGCISSDHLSLMQKQSKTAIKVTKTRLEAIRKKRNVDQKYLKSDVADLLRNGLDFNAYARVEVLLVEQNISACYEIVEQFCGCISSDHLSLMQKQRECPEEYKEAVSSLMYAAARFSDLPELRQLRSMFTERYSNSIEPYVSKEFVEKLRSKLPTKDMKLQAMHNIAQESSIEWDSKALEQKLFTPPAPEQDHLKYGPLHVTDSDRLERHKTKDDGNDHTMPKRNGRDLTAHGKKDAPADEYKLHISSEDEVIAIHGRDSTDQDNQWHCSSSVGTVSSGAVSADEEHVRRRFSYRFIPPPYIKPKPGNNEISTSEEPIKSNSDIHAGEKDHHPDDYVSEAKPKPRSVRRNKLKPPPGLDNVSNSESGGVAKANLDGHADGIDRMDEEDRILDGLLMHYSTKQFPDKSGKLKAPLEGNVGSLGLKISKSEFDIAPAAGAASTEPTTLTKGVAKGHARATSLQPQMLAGHVHPKLPDYDELAAQFLAHKGR